MAKDIIKRLSLNQLSAVTRHSEKTQQCIKLLKENKRQLNEPTISVSIQRWINDSCCANIMMNKCSLCKKNVLNNEEKEVSICKLVSDKLNHVCKGVDIFKISSIEDPQERYEACCNKDHVTVKLQEEFKLKRYKSFVSRVMHLRNISVS